MLGIVQTFANSRSPGSTLLMPDESLKTLRSGDSAESDGTGYRSVSLLAVAGLLLGLASPLAFSHPVLWGAAALAIGVNLLALRAIANGSREVVGRKAAILGLTLALFCITAAPVQLASRQALLRRQAQKAAETWFESLRNDAPHLAFQMSLSAKDRAAPSKNPKDSLAIYESGAKRDQLKTYVNQHTVRTLLALGKAAQVRYYDTESQTRSGNVDGLEQVYAVTFEEGADSPPGKQAGGKTTFFVKLGLVRTVDERTRVATWRVDQPEGGYRPRSWRGS